MTMKSDRLFRGDFGPVQPLETKAVTEKGEFEGYAAVFDNVDNGLDIIHQGAFTKSLQERLPRQIKLLFHHSPEVVLGSLSEVREDGIGLYVKGQFLLEVQKAKETHALMQIGAIEGLSMGYKTKQSNVDPATQIRHLREVDLREVSIVTFPMNEMAGVMLVKRDGTPPSEREFERYLMRDAGFSAQQAKAIIADGYKGLKLTREAGTGQSGGDAELAELLRQGAQRMRA